MRHRRKRRQKTNHVAAEKNAVKSGQKWRILVWKRSTHYKQDGNGKNVRNETILAKEEGFSEDIFKKARSDTVHLAHVLLGLLENCH